MSALTSRRLFLITVLIVLFFMGGQVFGIDLNSAIPRENCYPGKQPCCNKKFTDAYPNVSMSSTNLTVADTWFLLFTRRNKDKPEKLHKCAGRLPPHTNFKPNRRLIVIIQSFIVGYCDIAVNREWTAQFLKREDCNVLVVDYSWGNHIEYPETYLNSFIVAEQTGIVLKNIQEQTGIPKKLLLCVGLSQGAQICGITANYIKFCRIIGMEPGNQDFTEDMPLKDRLDPSDADLVEVWHTNMNQCLPNFGIGYDAGHVNYVINGGLVQKPCYEYAFTSILKQDFLYGFGTLLIPTLCWHAMSAVYFKVTINPGDCQFVAVKCKDYETFEAGGCNKCGKNGENCIIMGYDLDKYYIKTTDEKQRYFVDTSMHCPWCDNSKIQLEGFEGIYNSSLQTSKHQGRSCLIKPYCRSCV